MKVVLSAYECDPTRGSEYGRSWSWVKAYSEASHEVWCFTSVRGKPGIDQALAKERMDNVHFVFVELSKLFERKYGHGTFWVYAHYWLWLRKVYHIAKEIHQSVGFEAAHHFSWGSIQQGTTLWKLNVPLIMGPLGGGQFPPEGFNSYFLDGWPIETKRKLVSNLLLRFNTNARKSIAQATKILAMNHETAEMAKALKGNDVDIFVDTVLSPNDLHYQEKQIEGPFKLLWVGRLLYRKGLPLVLEALSQVESVPFSLTILGDGPAGKQLPDLIQSHNLSERVEWHGQVPFEQVKQAYRNHDALFFCTLRDSSATQFLEAMANALPIITLDIHGGKVIVPEQAGVKVKVNNPQQVVRDLADAVTTLYTDRERYSTASQTSYEFAAQIANRNKVQIIEEQLKNIRSGDPD